MFFRKNPKKPLKQAIQLVEEALEIAYRYKRDRSFHPNEADLAEFEAFEKRMWLNHATAEYINSCMNQRARGEPEGAKKFTDPKVFDYHYPP